MGLFDDLREAAAGFVQAVEGGRKVVTAADAAAVKAGRVAGHLTDEKTVAKVVGAGVGAALSVAADEARRAADGASGPRAPAPAQAGRRPGKSLGICCAGHGEQRWSTWRHTIVCAAPRCGRIFQTINPAGRHFAPPVCACGARLLPPAVPDGEPSSAVPLCSPCFDEAVAAGVDRMTQDPGGRA
jgi:hypothetical protein